MEICPKCGKKGLYIPSIMVRIKFMYKKDIKRICRYCNHKELNK